MAGTGHLSPQTRLFHSPDTSSYATDLSPWHTIKVKTGVTNNSAFQQLDNDTKQQVFLELKDCGASLRQLERLTGIGKGVIHRIWISGKL